MRRVLLAPVADGVGALGRLRIAGRGRRLRRWRLLSNAAGGVGALAFGCKPPTRGGRTRRRPLEVVPTPTAIAAHRQRPSTQWHPAPTAAASVCRWRRSCNAVTARGVWSHWRWPVASEGRGAVAGGVAHDASRGGVGAVGDA